MNMGWQAVFGLLNVAYFLLHYMFASQTAHVGALYSAFLAMMLSAGGLSLASQRPVASSPPSSLPPPPPSTPSQCCCCSIVQHYQPRSAMLIWVSWDGKLGRILSAKAAMRIPSQPGETLTRLTQCWCCLVLQCLALWSRTVPACDTVFIRSAQQHDCHCVHLLDCYCCAAANPAVHLQF